MRFARLVDTPGLAAAALALVVASTTAARADRIVLRGGTQIRGVVVPNPKGSPADQVLVQTDRITTPIKYRKDQVVQVISEPSALKEYLAKRDQTPAKADDQFELGLWCEQQKLFEYAQLHFERAVEVDKSYAPAHKKLGHVLYSDQWMTSDELRQAQGLIKYKGKWMTKEEKAKVEGQEAQAADHRSWTRRLKILRQSVLFGTAERRRDAEGQLAAINDASAIKPLLQVFGDDNDELRIMLDRILGGIEGPEAGAALVARILAEHESTVRVATMEELAKREDKAIVNKLVAALKSKDMAVVNRAAWALANLNAVSTVPKLVGSLVVTDQKMVWEVTESVSGGMSAGFSSYTSAPVAGLTGVATAPGAIAFGATGLPGFGTGTGISYGEPPGINRSYQPKLVSFTYRNNEVLSALEKLTGQNFGFDVSAWKRWVNTSFKLEPAPVRRVPQP